MPPCRVILICQNISTIQTYWRVSYTLHVTVVIVILVHAGLVLVFVYVDMRQDE